jgi:RNA polymerase sigma-70 factor (ECF subfamily)
VDQDAAYDEVVCTYGAALERLVRAYEADPDKRQDLLQDIHIAIWRSLLKFEQRSSLRTWIYRIAHNRAASHILRQQRAKAIGLVSLADLEETAAQKDHGRYVEQQMVAEHLLSLIHRLKPFDRQLMLLYLEDLDAASIGEITGMSAGSVRVQIHRIKAILAQRYFGGES